MNLFEDIMIYEELLIMELKMIKLTKKKHSESFKLTIELPFGDIWERIKSLKEKENLLKKDINF
jgi:hypothetical protein